MTGDKFLEVCQSTTVCVGRHDFDFTRSLSPRPVNEPCKLCLFLLCNDPIDLLIILCVENLYVLFYVFLQISDLYKLEICRFSLCVVRYVHLSRVGLHIGFEKQQKICNRTAKARLHIAYVYVMLCYVLLLLLLLFCLIFVKNLLCSYGFSKD